MKKIVWIAILTLVVAGVAYAETTEPPESKPTPPPAPPVEVKIELPPESAPTPPPTEAPAAAKPPAGFAGGASEAAPTPQPGAPTAQTPPTFGGALSGFGIRRRTDEARPTTPAPTADRTTRTRPTRARTPPRTAPATSRAMGFPASTAGTSVARTAVRTAYKFKIIDPDTGAVYGPFPLENSQIRIGPNIYKLQVIQYPEVVEQSPKTHEQTALEGKLRRTVMPEMTFEVASVTEVLDYLSREGDVNIVLLEMVREANFTITMRLKNIPLYDAIRYVTEVIGVYFRIDDHAVVITDDRPRSAPHAPGHPDYGPGAAR